ncbi:MAG TPA: formylglycine-generating enzyme family protein [Gammaproteobacteria bacterium]|nr:formylglycine-generating enzyme family protein [Gammaproteobacteria bacterium]
MIMMSRPVCVLVLLPSLFFSAATVAKESVPSKGYVHSQTQCIRCHDDKAELQEILTVSLGKCQTCHESATPTGAPQRHQKKVAANDFTRLDEPKRAVVPDRKPDYGMRFPLYPKGSRLGDAPNEMVLIPAGEFIMGSDSRLPDEGPQHRVTLPAFYIDKYEVTNLQYKKFNDATHGRSPRHWRNRTFPPGKADHPVVYVTWDNANDYCHWAGKRLPTDAEWEKAARGTDGRMFPWGDEFDTAKANTPVRWQEIGQFGDTTPVGAFGEGKSPYGVYDMSGNVWEWTASWYKAYPGNKTPSESYGERYKTLKGGSWFDCSFYKCGISAPVFNRSFFAKKVKNDSFGFRCAKDAEKR